MKMTPEEEAELERDAAEAGEIGERLITALSINDAEINTTAAAMALGAVAASTAVATGIPKHFRALMLSVFDQFLNEMKRTEGNA